MAKKGPLFVRNYNINTMSLGSTLTPSTIIISSHPRFACLRSSSFDHRFRLFSSFCLSSRECKLSGKASESKNIARRIRCSIAEVENGSLEDEACELVNGKELSISEGVDSIRAYLFQAVKNNNGIAVLLLSDVFGFEDSATRDFAYRVACNGYNVLVPDLFRGDPWAKTRAKEGFEQWLAKQDPKRVAKDIDTSKEWIINEFVSAGFSKKLGMIGFCFGGGKLIEALSRDEGEYFGAGVSFYGTRIDASLASKVKAPVLFVLGDNDQLCPVSLVENLEKTIGRGSRAVIFEGRGHGFVHRPQSAEEDRDAEEAFMLTRNWLQDRLVALNC